MALVTMLTCLRIFSYDTNCICRILNTNLREGVRDHVHTLRGGNQVYEDNLLLWNIVIEQQANSHRNSRTSSEQWIEHQHVVVIQVFR